ncbi:MAG: PKD domain-containing protein [Bacteroidales bacterium]|nr:PKD domain-containing protein [Bacteroidales bacterium]
MKKLAFIAAVLLLTACTKEKNPVADFGMSIISDSEVQVYNHSKNAEICTWEWGDGTYSGVYHPKSHIYPKSGTYTITLTVQSSEGLADATSKTFLL